MLNFTGGCVFGAIRYEVTTKPIMMFNCHCRDCQRTTGSAFTPVVYVPAKTFKITKGSPCYYSTPSEMVGHNKRGFCPECGSWLFGGEIEHGRGITASSLDDSSLFQPKVNMWISDAQRWDHMNLNLPKFEKHPPPR
jgi:hypothetical protein